MRRNDEMMKSARVKIAGRMSCLAGSLWMGLSLAGCAGTAVVETPLDVEDTALEQEAAAQDAVDLTAQAVTAESEPEAEPTWQERLLAMTVTIPFGDDTEYLTGETISGWLMAVDADQDAEDAADADGTAAAGSGTGAAGDAGDAAGQADTAEAEDTARDVEDAGDADLKTASVHDEGVVLDAEQVREYVNSLARKYDTFGATREFTTYAGETITVRGGDYGWWMNRPETTTALLEVLEQAEDAEFKPIYFAEGYRYGVLDYDPDNYVEIDLDNQCVYVYSGGELVVESPCVSGKVSAGNYTPDGTYSITYKDRNATLTGQGYASPVDYWMPFNGNIGMHDATWRSSFGGEIYLRSGSHGCVNLPHDKAAQIYSYVEKGEAVIVYGGRQSTPPVAQETVTQETEGEEQEGVIDQTQAQTEDGSQGTIGEQDTVGGREGIGAQDIGGGQDNAVQTGTEQTDAGQEQQGGVTNGGGAMGDAAGGADGQGAESSGVPQNSAPGTATAYR